jgi:hypothetical protein
VETLWNVGEKLREKIRIAKGHGAWGMGHGAWGMGHGAWGMGHGPS